MTKKERRQASYAMQKCACGSIAGLGQTQCSRCRDNDEAAQEASTRLADVTTLLDALENLVAFVDQTQPGISTNDSSPLDDAKTLLAEHGRTLQFN